MDAPLCNPFPGLRPFEPDESHLFFGREGQSDELLRRLRRNRFLAVVGTSGSGKSSLVRAGLLPSLHGGFMAETAASWWVACFRPGSDPIGHLAAALAGIPGFAPAGSDPRSAALCVEITLRRSGLGLLDAARQARLPAGQSLLVVADQFEELFRFKQSVDAGRACDAAAFVKLLLEATAQTEVPVYVVLTMRSDYLGDCAQFRDLPERLNDAQYLIPHMTRDQRREAITGPVLVGGGRIAPRLVNRLLNAVGDNPDQLPILQHALMRTWDLWACGDLAGEIDVEHYKAVGGMTAALSRHADEAYEELSGSRRALAEVLFRRLTEKGPDNREIRFPARLCELAAVTGAPEEEVAAVVESFRREGRSFLMPRFDVPLETDSVIDISHESLIRGWQRLKDWVDEESRSAQTYRRVADAAARYAEGGAALWRDPDLAQALRWRERNRPNEAWAARYHPGFGPAMAFLDASRQEDLAETRRKEGARVRLVWMTRIMAALLILAVGLAAFAGLMKWKADGLLAQSYWWSGLQAMADREPLKATHLFSLYIHKGKDPALRDASARNVQRLFRVLLVDLLPETGIARAANGTPDGWVFSPTGTRLAAWAEDGSFVLRDVRRGDAPRVRLRHPGMSGAVFSGDGNRLLSWGADGTARLWRVADGSSATAPLRHGGRPVKGGVFSRDAARVLTWNDEPAAPASPGSTTPQSSYGALPSGSAAHLWSTSDGSSIPLPSALLHTRELILGAEFDADGRHLLVWSGAAAQLLDLEGEREQPRTIPHAITGAAFSRDGGLILTWGVDGTAQLWKAADGSSVEAPPMRQESAVLGASFSHDARQVLTWGVDGARLWTLSGHQPLVKVSAREEILSAELVEDRWILTADSDGFARLWNAADGSLEAELLHGGSLAAAKLAGGHRIVTWGTDGTRLWDVDGAAPDRPARASFSREKDGALPPGGKSASQPRDLEADLDFPRSEWPLLVEVALGAGADDEGGGERALSSAEWRRKQAKYVRVAEEHLGTCEHRDANLYLRQKELWAGRAPIRRAGL